MKKPHRALHDIARRVIHSRYRDAPSLAASADAMQLSCGELYRVLETAMGPAGLQALITRAIKLTARDYPWLAQVKVGNAAGCALSGLTEAAERLDVAEANEGYAALLATIVSLLVTFIGEELTLRFLRLAWPDAALKTNLEDSRA